MRACLRGSRLEPFTELDETSLAAAQALIREPIPRCTTRPRRSTEIQSEEEGEERVFSFILQSAQRL